MAIRLIRYLYLARYRAAGNGDSEASRATSVTRLPARVRATAPTSRGARRTTARFGPARPRTPRAAPNRARRAAARNPADNGDRVPADRPPWYAGRPVC